MFRHYIFFLDHIRRQGHPSLLVNGLANSDLWTHLFMVLGVSFYS